MTTAPDAVIERIAGYIRHNATKEPAQLLELVARGHDQLLGTIDGLSGQQATFKPAPGEWCVLEVLQHVVTAKRGVARICQRLGRGEQVAGFGGEGEEQDGVMGEREFASLAQARVAIEAAHEELVEFIQGPMARADVETRFGHFLFGELNCREWAAFQRVHDGDHAGQMEKIKMSPGFPAG